MGIEFAKKEGKQYKIYIDKGVSGANRIEDRPELQRLLEDIEDEVVTEIYVTHQDRLERSELTWFTLLDVFVRKNITLYEDSKKVDFDDESVLLLKGLQTSIHAGLVRKTTRKIKNKVARNIKAGKAHGIMAYGYKQDADRMLAINEEEAEVVRLIFQLSMEGKGYIAIGKELDRRGIPTKYALLKEHGKESTDTYEVKNPYTGEVEVREKGVAGWVQATVRGILKNKLYKGKRKHKDIYYDVPHLEIIPPDFWDRVNSQITANEKPRGMNASHKYLLNDLMECGTCGKRMTGRSMTGNLKSGLKNYSYRCVDKRQKLGNRCDQRDIKSYAIEDVIWDRLFISGRILDNVKNHIKENVDRTEFDTLTKKIESMKVEQQELMNKKQYVLDLIFNGQLKEDQIQTRLDQADEDITNLGILIGQEKDKLQYELDKMEKEGEVEADLKQLKDNIPFKSKQDIIRKYVKRIKVSYVNKLYVVVIKFHLDIHDEVYTIDNRYNLAVEAVTNNVIPLSEKYRALRKKGRKSGDIVLKDDRILDRLVMAQLKLDIPELQGRIMFLPPKAQSKLHN